MFSSSVSGSRIVIYMAGILMEQMVMRDDTCLFSPRFNFLSLSAGFAVDIRY